MKYKVKFDLDFKRNPYRGKFIVLEGIDASGKTTQTKRVGKILGKKEKIILTKNPTNGIIGSFIRKTLRGKIKIPPVSFQYLFVADRQIQIDEIASYLKKGITVISDRYFWSSVAYGMVDRKETNHNNTNEISLAAFSILSMYHRFFLPDLTIYLDIPIKKALKRIKESSKHDEIYDKEEVNKKIDKGYKWLIKKFPKEFVIVNADKDREELTEEIVKIINGYKK